ncbi:MAG: NAD(+)/NADH kinase, partial [Halobacteriales archaeon]
HVISNDDGLEGRWKSTLRERGFDVVEAYDPDAVVVTIGGDGTILYAAREFPEPTILPVRAGDSKGYRTHLDSERLVEALERIETGERGDAYAVAEHRRIAAYRDGQQLQGGFDALNEISLHHSSPTLAAVLGIRIRDGDEAYELDRVICDGVVVATPFGSTAYYRAITGGTFSHGLGIAFNNVHTPSDAPAYRVVSPDGVVEVERLTSEHASGAVLTRDNADETYELDVGERITIRGSGDTVEILNPLLPGR